MNNLKISWRAAGSGLAVLAVPGLLSFLGVWEMTHPVLTPPLPITQGNPGTSGTADLEWKPDDWRAAVLSDLSVLSPQPQEGTCMQVTPTMTLEIVPSCGCGQEHP
jgi:hypothetical protein